MKSPSSLTVPLLKAELKKRGLDTSGRKDDLVQRLQQALDEEPEDEEKEEVEETKRPKRQTKASKKKAEEDDGEDEDEEEAPPPKSGRATAKRQAKTSKKAEDEDEDEDEEDEGKKKRKAPAKRGRKKADEGEAETAPSKRPKRTTKAAKKAEDEDEEDEDEEEPAPAPAPKKAAAKKKQPEPAEESDEKSDDGDEEPLPAAPKKPKSTVAPPVDSACPIARSAKVYQDYDVMLNQTNIGQNNNKYYIIQLLESGSSYSVWTHWGRVGESGQNKLDHCASLDKAIKGFENKFKDKTKNNWTDRDSFVAVPGKYTIVEIDHSGGDEAPTTTTTESKTPRNVAKCTLDQPTQELIKLIFDHDMFNNSMKEMEIDVEKMPLGKLTKSQVQKGHAVLDRIRAALENGSSNSTLATLSSEFYTLIPHSFGRRTPTVLNSAELLQKKVELLNTLADIEHAQSLLKTSDGGDDAAEVPHQFDRNYKLLKNELRLLDKSSEEFEIINNYIKATRSGPFQGEILEAWALDRQGEKERMEKYRDITNRKLLWHGTSVAVVVAILSSGLRIMPHSGGRVGRGIYHASEHAKSASYTGRVNNNIGLMFLDEVALGKQHEIYRDDPSLRQAPAGFDSVLAVGHTEPDPSKDTTIEDDFGPITVPQGKPIKTKGAEHSSFIHSEYLVYDEAQVRMRYMLKVRL